MKHLAYRMTAAMLFSVASAGQAQQLSTAERQSYAMIATSYVCYASGASNIVGPCVTLRDLSGSYPERAAQFAAQVLERLQRRGADLRAPSSVIQALERLRNDPELLGCGQNGGEAGATLLTAPVGASGPDPRQTVHAALQRRGEPVRQLCVRLGAQGGPLAGMMPFVAVANRDMAEFEDAYRRQATSCNASNRQGGRQGLMMSKEVKAEEPAAVGVEQKEKRIVDYVRGEADSGKEERKEREGRSRIQIFFGTIWSWIDRGNPDEDPGPNAVTGIRGDCLPDSGLACEQSCTSVALTRAATELMTRFRYDGCGAEVRPTPDGGGACARVRAPRGNVPSTEDAKRIRELWCRRLPTAANPDGRGYGDCAFYDASQLDRNVRARSSICSDPRAMCSPDQPVRDVRFGMRNNVPPPGIPLPHFAPSLRVASAQPGRPAQPNPAPSPMRR